MTSTISYNPAKADSMTMGRALGGLAGCRAVQPRSIDSYIGEVGTALFFRINNNSSNKFSEV